MFPVNGSLHMAPLFPRLGPGESGSPTSQVLLRCYDFPFMYPRSLICFASGVHATSSVRVSPLALALPEGQRMPSRPGSLFNRRPKLPVCSHVDVSGTSQVPRRSVPCLCLVPGPRPNRRPSPIDGFVDAAPAPFTARASAFGNFGATTRLQHLLPTLHEWCRHHPCKARFRLAGSPLPGGS